MQWLRTLPVTCFGIDADMLPKDSSATGFQCLIQTKKRNKYAHAHRIYAHMECHTYFCLHVYQGVALAIGQSRIDPRAHLEG